ncbi:MAG: SDR family oxidoreductase, partial [Deltaproteobacteria bacterium]
WSARRSPSTEACRYDDGAAVRSHPARPPRPGRRGCRVRCVPHVAGRERCGRPRAHRRWRAVDMTARQLARIPLARLGQAAEVAACVAFHTSPAASDVVGHALTVDGGLSI